MNKIILASIFLASFGMSYSALDTPETATVKSSVKIEVPLKIGVTQDMVFDTITLGETDTITSAEDAQAAKIEIDGEWRDPEAGGASIDSIQAAPTEHTGDVNWNPFHSRITMHFPEKVTLTNETGHKVDVDLAGWCEAALMYFPGEDQENYLRGFEMDHVCTTFGGTTDEVTKMGNYSGSFPVSYTVEYGIWQ